MELALARYVLLVRGGGGGILFFIISQLSIICLKDTLLQQNS
jgi:hypothetical protein